MKEKTRNLVLAAVFSALIAVMTVVPYTGYINYGPISLEITTLHIVVILGAVCLGWKYGAVLGGVWGVSCMLRALTNPLWYDFLNPMISLLPRIAVGLVAALVFIGLTKIKVNSIVSSALAAVAGTVTNTILVLSMYSIFGGGVTQGFFATFKSIIMTIVSVNGIVELVAAVIFVPIVYKTITKSIKSK